MLVIVFKFCISKTVIPCYKLPNSFSRPYSFSFPGFPNILRMLNPGICFNENKESVKRMFSTASGSRFSFQKVHTLLATAGALVVTNREACRPGIG